MQVGNFIYTTGQIPVDLKTGIPVKSTIEEKAKKTLENLKLVLEAWSTKLADVVKISVFVNNLDYVSLFNEIYKTISANTLKEMSITVNSTSKTYAMTDWRVGYVAGPREIIKGTNNLYKIMQREMLIQ